MRFVCVLAFCLILSLATLPAGAQTGRKKKEPDARPPAQNAIPPANDAKLPAAEPPLRLPMNPLQPPYYAKIESIGKDGSVQIGPPSQVPPLPPGSRPVLAEGYYVGVVMAPPKPLDGARLIRVEVTELKDDDVAEIQVGKSAAEALKAGEILMLFRPHGITTARMKALPDLVLLAEGAAPGEKRDEGVTIKLNQSFNNLKQIGLAFHNFHDVYRHFPPAVIVGPDNKPWHSWRVLLLPFLEQAPIYEQYRFDEPWDGPNNKKLLDRMPALFSDPIHGDNREFYTHYVAITGDDMAFTAEGADFDGKNLGPAIGAGRGIAQFTDGSSNTLLVGPVGPDRKIPWLKPDDIRVDDKFPDLGKKGGFAAPYKMEKGNAAPFLRCDGSVTAILDGIDGKTFHALLTLDGGENIGEYPNFAPAPMGGRMMPVIYVITEGKKTSARLVREPMPAGQLQMPGMMMVPPGPAIGDPPLPAPAPARGVKKRVQNP